MECWKVHIFDLDHVMLCVNTHCWDNHSNCKENSMTWMCASNVLNWMVWNYLKHLLQSHMIFIFHEFRVLLTLFYYLSSRLSMDCKSQTVRFKSQLCLPKFMRNENAKKNGMWANGIIQMRDYYIQYLFDNAKPRIIGRNCLKSGNVE